MSNDWAVFHRYAARVRELAYHEYWDVRLPYYIRSSVFETLLEHNLGQLLLPKLRVLTWQRSSSDHSLGKLLRMLASPTLSTFRIVHPMWTDSGPVFAGPPHFDTEGHSEDVQVIADACPMLQHFLTNNTFQPSDLDPIASCRSLQSFAARSVDVAFFWRLAQLPDLAYLRAIELRNDKPPEALDTGSANASLSSRQPFPALRRVDFLESHPRPVIIFFTCIPSVALVSITLELREACMNDIPLCVQALCSQNRAGTLTELRLTFLCTRSLGEDESEYSRFADVARPLLGLAVIEVLSLSVHGRALSLSDDDVAEMAQSWPHIVALSVVQEPYYPYGRSREENRSRFTRPSVSALVSLAQNCPRLTSLRFDPADVSEEELQSLEERAASAVPRTGLSRLVLTSGETENEPSFGDIRRLAFALHRLFPDLEGMGVLKGSERRPVHEEISVWDVERDSDAYTLQVALDALQAERLRGSRERLYVEGG